MPGEVVEFTIDNVPYQARISRNQRAALSLPGFDSGTHMVELTDPAGCFDPIAVACPAGLSTEGTDLWDNDATGEVPSATSLLGNYPNPFNPSTTFRYGLSEPGQVNLKVYNMIGQLVKTVVNDYQNEGYHEGLWDGRNESGATVASGIYVYRMTISQQNATRSNGFVETGKILLMK